MEHLDFLQSQLEEQNFNFEIEYWSTGLSPSYSYRGVISITNNKTIIINRESYLSNELCVNFKRIYDNSTKLICFIDYYINKRFRVLKYEELYNHDINPNLGLGKIIGIKNILDRIDEFEVVKGNKLDLISLDNLLDFYEIRYVDKLFGDYMTEKVFDPKLTNV